MTDKIEKYASYRVADVRQLHEDNAKLRAEAERLRAALRMERTDEIDKDRLKAALRQILVGLWSRLDKDDQADHIAELQHYFEGAPGTYLSGIAAQIRDA